MTAIEPIPPQHVFTEVRLAVEGVLIEARIAKQAFRSVKWSSLRCRELLWCTDGDGDTHWSAVVEGAAPKQSKFVAWLHNRLSVIGYPNVRIQTQW